MLLHIKYLPSVLLVIILLNNVTGSNLRRRKMLVRRKVAINRNIIARTQTNGTVLADEKQIKRPVKVIKRKILGSNSEPRPVISQLSLPPVPEPETTTPSATILPQHKPFTVNETVPAKPDAVKRFLSLFTIVSWKQGPCTSSAGTNGTCYSSNECSALGGSASGTCASGFGVCCLVTVTCGASTSVNGTYFQNTGYPSTYNSVSSCRLTINKCTNDVCQLRLDMENMVLAQPETTDNQCQSDQFIVSGGTPVPALCGTLTGSHMYVDMGLDNNNPIVLTVVSSGASFERSFNIKVTQIECDSLSKAGDGCLQYFTGVSGQMFSFNYNNAEGLQLSNTDYTMCVRMERNFCGIQYTACPDASNTPPQAFSVTGGSPTLGSIVGTSCITDWITIPCATNTNDPTTQSGIPVVCVDRICGQVFNSVTTPNTSPNVPVYSYSKPFNIYVHTDSLEGSSSPAESSNRSGKA